MLRTDPMGFGSLRLLQETEDFCYGIDAVLLASFANLSSTDKVLDMCTGNGAAAFIAWHKYRPAMVTGLEVYEGSYELACQSAKLNGLEGKLNFVLGDALNVRELFGEGSFSAVTINPPYTEKGRGPKSVAGPKALARHESTASLSDFFAAASYCLADGGSLTMVHRPSRLVDILSYARGQGLEAKRMRFVCPKPGEASNIVLVQFVKGGGKELILEPELAVRNADGSYTDEIDRIYERKTDEV